MTKEQRTRRYSLLGPVSKYQSFFPQDSRTDHLPPCFSVGRSLLTSSIVNQSENIYRFNIKLTIYHITFHIFYKEQITLQSGK